MRDDKYNSALFYAVSNSFFDVVKLLLELGSNVNLKNSLGNSALHKAFMTRNILLIHLLLERRNSNTAITPTIISNEANSRKGLKKVKVMCQTSKESGFG